MVSIMVYITHLVVNGALERAQRGVTQSMKKSDYADDLPCICNKFAKVWKLVCHHILQGICYYFTMHTKSCRKAFTTGLSKVSNARAHSI
jgi:hypothetical protein